jgi:hypothetical protein
MMFVIASRSVPTPRLSRLALGANLPEQAVIVHFAYGQTDLGPLFELEDQLIAVIDAAGVGEFDGNEVARDGSDGYLYMYGPDADRLFEAIRPILESATCIYQPVVTIRYGPPEDGVRERKVALGS